MMLTTTHAVFHAAQLAVSMCLLCNELLALIACVQKRCFSPFLPRVPKWGTVTKGFDARLANRPFLVFDFWALWRSGLSARVPESQKIKKVG